MLEERKREFIEKPLILGVPPSRATEYLQGRLSIFRKEHSDFDEFLKKVRIHLKNSKEAYYENLIKFLDGKSEANWISPRGTIFDTMIKIYNRCLSPKQAFEYIEKSRKLYTRMTSIDYELDNSFNIYTKTSRWDRKERKFIDCTLLSNKNPVNPEYSWSFDITFSDFIVVDSINDITAHADISIEVVSHKNIYKDAFALFDNYQNREFKRKLLDSTISAFISNGVIKSKEKIQIEHYDEYAYQLLIDKRDGKHSLSDFTNLSNKEKIRSLGSSNKALNIVINKIR